MTLLDPTATYAQSMRDQLAVVDLASNRRWTYGALHAAIDRLAAWIVGQFGPASGERLSTLSKNNAEMVILQLATIRAGAVFMPLNWRLAVTELEALVADATPVLLFAQSGFTVPSNVERIIDIADMLSLGTEGTAPPAAARRPFDALATLLYTSGTSGRPKGVMLSEENNFWGCTNLIHGNAVNPSSTFLCDMPLFHTAGLSAATRTPLLAGGTVLISEGFDPELTLARMSDPALGVTHYFSVPQSFRRSLPGPSAAHPTRRRKASGSSVPASAFRKGLACPKRAAISPFPPSTSRKCCAKRAAVACR
jgi:fatty-acyl-CoA synthase